MKIKFSKKDLITIPNILTYIRILLIPIIVNTYIEAKSTADYYKATILFIICALTDSIDGFVARRFNQITDIGKILDPIADKAMQAAILLCLVIRIDGILPIFILFVVKELFMGIAGFFFIRSDRQIVGAKWFGKVCTVVLDTNMVILFAFPNLNENVVRVLLMLTTLFLVFSFIMYAFDYYKIFTESTNE